MCSWTAWRIAVPEPKSTVSNVAGALSLWLSLDALDWILTIQGMAEASAQVLPVWTIFSTSLFIFIIIDLYFVLFRVWLKLLLRCCLYGE
jgi:hypothetical protein